MLTINRYNPVVSPAASNPQIKTAVLWVAVACVLVLSACLPTPANAQSGRFDIQQVGDALTSYGKNTVNDNGHPYYSVVCGHDSWKSSVVSLSSNANVIWLQLDLVELPAHVSPAALETLLKKNTELGPLFFSISDNWLRISSPLPNNDMSEAKLKGYLSRLVDVAVDSHDLWDSRILESAVPATARGSAAGPKSPSAHSSLSRSVDEFDESLSSVQHQ